MLTEALLAGLLFTGIMAIVGAASFSYASSRAHRAEQRYASLLETLDTEYYVFERDENGQFVPVDLDADETEAD